MYLLDTNIISELRKPRPHGAVLAWYGMQETSTLMLPSIVVYELQMGANRTRKQDVEKAVEIDRWIDGLAQLFLVLPFGADEARLTADFMTGRSVDLVADMMIAASAAVYALTLVTRNTSDFTNLPVRLLNPFLPLRNSDPNR